MFNIMKKSLLLVAMSFAVSSMIAQSPFKVTKDAMVKSVESNLGVAPSYKTLEEGASNSHRSIATKLWYSLPQGATYLCWNKEGSGYGASYVMVAPWKEFTFVNASENPTTNKWHFNYLSSSSSSYRDLTEYADENGNYTNSLNPGYYQAAPTLCDEQLTDSFTIGYPGAYWGSQDAYKNYFTRVSIDSVATMAFINDHGKAGSSGYGWGSLSSGYLYGTGTIDGSKQNRGIGVCKAVYQDFPKPMSPLYVEDIFVQSKSVTLKPLAENKVLNMYVIATTISDDKIVETKDTIAKLTATPEDFVLFGKEGTSDYSSTGKYQRYTTTFTQKTEDEFGLVSAEPFAIDKPFRVKIVGLDEEGVDFGISQSSGIDEENVWIEEGVFQVYYPDVNETRNHYYTGMTIKFCFTAMFDGVQVADVLEAGEDTFKDCNIITVSNDGTQCKVDLGGDNYLPGVMVYTAQPWTETVSHAEEYYFATELPEWITSLNVDESAYAKNGVNLVSVTCSPLPNDVKGRTATFYIQGRGVTSEVPIIVVQGEVPTAIAAVKNDAAVKANAAMFNIAGQRVNDSFKGMVIKDGKKFMNK